MWHTRGESIVEKPSGTYCALPWNSVNVRNNGDMRICCNANSYSPRRGILTKEDGTPYNAGRDDWNEARNSELLKDVRKYMLNGEWHPECERCRQEEESGQTSRRMYDTRYYSVLLGDTTLEKVKEYTLDDGTLDTSNQPIEFMDIRYGNFCNLKCRMCGPTDSHSWYEDFTKLYDVDSFDDTHGKVHLVKNSKGRLTTSDYDWFEQNNTYWKNFDKYAHSSKRLYIVGGEPLIIKEHNEALERLVASGASEHIEIEYNTNLTNITPRVKELWSKFKLIRLGASIDGFGDVFTYQREPAKWDAVYKNIRELDDDSTINLKAWFSFTVTVFNIFHLPEFMRWKLETGNFKKFNALDHPKPILSYHMCHGPKMYNVKILPPEIKQQVTSRYQEYRDWINNSDFDDRVKKSFNDILDGVEKFMYKEDLSELMPKFVKYTKKLDSIRGQNILDIVPEYEKYFK